LAASPPPQAPHPPCARGDVSLAKVQQLQFASGLMLQALHAPCEGNDMSQRMPPATRHRACNLGDGQRYPQQARSPTSSTRLAGRSDPGDTSHRQTQQSRSVPGVMPQTRHSSCDRSDMSQRPTPHKDCNLDDVSQQHTQQARSPPTLTVRVDDTSQRQMDKLWLELPLHRPTTPHMCNVASGDASNSSRGRWGSWSTGSTTPGAPTPSMRGRSSYCESDTDMS